MQNIVIIDQEVINEIRNNQFLILKKLEISKSSDSNDKYISKPTAAKMWDCDEQTIANFEKEGIVKRYGRGRFIRYSVHEIKIALGILL